MSDFLLRVPDHLGDGVMAIPAVRAIAELGTAHVVGPRWATRLYGLGSGPSHADVAILFKPSFSAAWSHRHIHRRVGIPGDWRRWLLTDVVQPKKAHRTDHYAALAQTVGATPTNPPVFSPTETEKDRAPDLQRGDVLLLPMSNSQKTVGWPHFRALADRLNGRAVFAAGPGECDALRAIAGSHRRLPPLPLGEFGAVAVQASHVIGNDSGLSHLASASRRAAGIDPATTHVFFGSTDPEQTGPIGCTPHRLLHFACSPCYRKSCRIRTHSSPCMDIPFQTLLETVQ